MNDDLKKLKKIRDFLVGVEMQLNLLYSNLNVVCDDLTHMYTVENELIENIKILKQDYIVAIASEYRRSIRELDYVRKKIAQWRNKQTILERRIARNQRIYKQYSDDFNALKKFVDNRKVVLLFDQNKRRKKK